ncbi:MAG: 50S ribosomal protein L25/general stress protein Ctc [Gammaproteobacteria bacterium]|nr:MAG: 50S ribosomal protein L25/general stress protein Ctc [Gammaproteobacteria bacterium]
MADKIVLSAEPRSDVGKGASRRLRRLAARVPGIIYGGGQDPRNISLSHRELLKAMEAEAFYSQVLEVSLDGEGVSTIVKDVQRHPSKPQILHVDFQRIRADQEITVNIPVHLLNEEACKGVRLENGRVAHHIMEVEVSCLPAALPEYFEIDLADLGVGDSVYLSGLAVPEGVTLTQLALGEDHDQPVVSIEEARIMEEETGDDTEAASDAEVDAEDGDDADKDGDDTEADDKD